MPTDITNAGQALWSEAEVEAMAERQGLRLLKADSGFQVFSPSARAPIGGSSFQLTLDEAASIILTIVASRA